jgi:8-oxo-dGTP pyrophosphatase MutT (NUDIX family)
MKRLISRLKLSSFIKIKSFYGFHDKYKIWAHVGGHIELDEDPNEAVLREIKEEVGLDVKLYDGNKLLDYENDEEKYSFHLLP